ncbi:hypothetical protein RhiirA5_495090 [Rhizophagus irregularis]|uniref:Uncharacterized protein n=1 Tax=Rhizophagus irregularis TaxID=588596 RepID=A0A2I1DV31_9GLOM|nr:hypothetical protein RhiirA5_495090 [Rhizophagus irregularis]PKC74189.1 hypothetical protein RhiirA1_529820 [Rhizophagus irregularis]PKY13731.1 hypothetical protein RhiirB3_519061 [Rhizophagus irregularis]
MDNINYVLKWNNITVEQSPRKFISQSSKVKGFEEFFNLARNTKYRRNCIDWKMTFDILSGSEVPNDTTFKSSASNNRISYYNISFIDYIWILHQQRFYLTFIDFIKGFVPLSLVQFLTSQSFKAGDIYDIVAELNGFVYEM